LQDKAVTAEQAGAKALAEADAELHAGRAAQKPVLMDHIAVAGRHLERMDAARHLGGEGDQPRPAGRAIFRHEQPATGQRAADGAEQAAGAGRLRGGVQLHIIAHPGKFARFGDNPLPGIETDLQDGHRRPGDGMFHVGLCPPHNINYSFSL
jgi:hypothetical protein